MTEGTTWDARPADAGPQRAWVAVTWGERRDVVELPEQTEVSIGRSRSSGIAIEDSSVSRLHATLRWDAGGHVTLVDHGSRNGVFLRGVRVRGSATLGTGDELAVGPARLVVVVPTAPPPADDAAPFAMDRAMRAVVAQADRAALSSLPVMIVGETGVGKELLARRIHERSARSTGPFIPANCAAIPESLAESALFGHEKGAFTGADARRAGLFEAADGGTLFLDEVGELSSATQAKLLRVLEEAQVTPVGATRPIAVDVRIVAATHRDLRRMVQEGVFREDLSYRLDVVRFGVPPLRERPDDVLWLAHRFLAEHGSGLTLDQSAKQCLRSHSWPGNVRELKNAVARAAALRNRDVLKATDFELARKFRSGAAGLTGAVADAERETIEAALESCDGNQTRAAARLGISRRALIYKMEKHGLKPLPPSKRG